MDDTRAPTPTPIETRVSRLKEGMRDVKAILGRLEPVIVRIDARMPQLATKEDMARIDARLSHVPTKEEIAYLRGRVEQLPSTGALITTVLGANVALAGLVVAAAELFGH